MKNPVSLSFFIILFPFLSFGQVQSAFPVSTAKNGALEAVVYDWEVIGVNPANLGWAINHQFSFTILDVGASGQSQGMKFPTLMTAMNSSSLADKAFAWQHILGTTQNGMNANADINWVAASWKINNIPGAFAANIRDRVFGNAFLGPHATTALLNSTDREFNDATIMSYLDGTTLKYLHYREINLDYGVQLFGIPSGGADESASFNSKCFSFTKKSTTDMESDGAIYAGIGIKYITGLASVNGGIEDGGLDALYDMSSSYPNIFNHFFSGPGQGFGLDLGLSGDYKRWIFGISITDMGSIRWHSAKNLKGDTSMAFINSGNDFMNGLKTGTLTGSVPAPDFSTSLPTDMRIGASYKVNRHLLISSDMVYPVVVIPGSLTGLYFAIGPQWKATKILTLSTGIATSKDFGWGIPLGLTLHATHNIDFYLGTGDIAAYLGKSYNTNVSAAVWSFRWNF